MKIQLKEENLRWILFINKMRDYAHSKLEENAPARVSYRELSNIWELRKLVSVIENHQAYPKTRDKWLEYCWKSAVYSTPHDNFSSQTDAEIKRYMLWLPLRRWEDTVNEDVFIEYLIRCDIYFLRILWSGRSSQKKNVNR